MICSIKSLFANWSLSPQDLAKQHEMSAIDVTATANSKPNNLCELKDAMAHALPWNKGTKSSHHAEVDFQRTAAFRWAGIVELINTHRLWPVGWSKNAIETICQKTIGRIGMSTKAAHRASASIQDWRLVIEEADWEDAEHLIRKIHSYSSFCMYTLVL